MYAEMEVALLVCMVLERFGLQLESTLTNAHGLASSERSDPAPRSTESGSRRSWIAQSGDLHGCLPPMNSKRLVGIKVPAAACWVLLTSRASPDR